MAMTVRGKNIEVTPALRDYVAKRIGKITKYFDDLRDITVVLTVEKGRHIVEVTAPLNGMLLRGEESTGDMYASVDLVIEKLEKQIAKHKTRLARKLRPNGFKGDLAVSAAEGEERVVKTKRFTVKPMPVEEAILQMNLIGHDFFVFANADTEEINVLYRRKDGNYGLIEPELG